jgi:hypothetical protein
MFIKLDFMLQKRKRYCIKKINNESTRYLKFQIKRVACLKYTQIGQYIVKNDTSDVLSRW